MVGRTHLLWGVVGGLSFLGLLQGYELITGYRAPLIVKFGLAAVVVVVSTGLTATVAERLRGKGSP